MAEANNNTLFFKIILVLTLLLFISVAESRNFGFGKKDSSLACDSVYGAESGDTCSIVAEAFGLSLQDFLAINPNINCDAIFVGQWLCLGAST